MTSVSPKIKPVVALEVDNANASKRCWLSRLKLDHFRNYQQARLAFSVAVNLQPDILLLDEVLSVGDQPFREKCLRRLQEFQQNGVTMVIVSHSPELLNKLCTRAVLMDHGTIRMTGDITAVLEEYTTGSRVESK